MRAPCVPLLIDGDAGCDAGVRRSPRPIWGSSTKEAATPCRALIDGTDGSEAEVRRASAAALGSFGADAAPAVPALRKAAGDTDPDVAREAGGDAGQAAAEEVHDATGIQSGARRATRCASAAELARERDDVLGAPAAAPLREIGAAAALAAEALDQLLQHRGAVDGTSGARAITTADGGGTLKSTATCPAALEIADAIVFRPFASQPSSACDDDARVAVRLRALGERRRFEGGEPRLQILELPLRVLGLRLQPLDAGRQSPAGPTAAGCWPRPRRAAPDSRAARGRRTGTRRGCRRESAPTTATAMMPIAPVRATCVPPHAERSKSSHVDQPQLCPSRAGSLRSGSVAASSASAKRIVDRPVFPDDPVGFVLGALDVGRRHDRDRDRSWTTTAPR